MKGVYSLILIVTLIYLADAAYEDLCARFKEGMKFREPENCQAYVTCKNGIGTVTTCPTGQLYDKSGAKCVATLDDPYCNNPCEGKEEVWVQHRTNCISWYYCDSEEAFYGECADGFHFNGSNAMCIYETDSFCADVSDFCGIVVGSFSDPKNCREYFNCDSKGKLTHPKCKATEYYNVELGACKNMDDVPCEVHTIPSGICGSDTSPKSGKFVSDAATCRGYYYCADYGKSFADRNPSWHQCNEGLFFDEKAAACVDPPLVRCTHNRCEGRGNALVVADTWGCRYYHECQNGAAPKAEKCPWDMFFSERLQACIYDEVSDPACDYLPKPKF